MFRKKREVVLESSPEGARDLLHALGDPFGVRMMPVFGDLIMEVSRSAPKIRANGRTLSPGRHLLVPGDHIAHGRARLRLAGSVAAPAPQGGTRTMARAALSSSPASGPAVGPCLLVMEGGAAGRRWPLVEGRQVIGRSLDCEVVITEPSVSRRHAEIVLGEGKVWIRDLGSRHGLRLGKRRAKGRKLLRPGEELIMGLARLRLVLPAQILSVDPSALGEAGKAAKADAAPAPGREEFRQGPRAGSSRDLWIAAWALGLLAIGGAISTLALAS